MEVIKLRPHHASEIKERLEWHTDPKDLVKIMVHQGYDTQTILTVLEIYQKVRNPKQIIEILPEEDLVNDPICRNCVTVRNRSGCDKPSLPGRVGKDGFETLRYGLRSGEQLSVEELLKKKRKISPHFKM